jgi:transcription antitermination factor NusG
MSQLQKASSPNPSSRGSNLSSKKWVCVELTHAGEKEKNLSLITKSARRILKNKEVEVFIPAVTQKVRDESSILSFMEGYVFIAYQDNILYTKLQETNYFRSVLTKPVYEGRRKRRVLSLLDDSELRPMRKGMESLNRGDFKPGDSVKVKKGNYKNLNAEVIIVFEDEQIVQVYVELRSKKILLDFPASYLSKV